MSLRIARLLLTALGWLAVAAVPSFGQGISDMQLFAPADLGGFGGGTRATEGLFFTFDGLGWSISQPEAVPIGTMDPPNGQFNVETTGFMDASFESGLRVEAGTVKGHRGLLFSYFDLNNQVQKRQYHGVSIFFGQNFLSFNPTGPDDADLLFAEDYRVRNEVDLWGVELNYLLRSHPMHHGGFLEFFAGARYIEFNEEFRVTANRESLTRFWQTSSDNHLIGPQVGGRWFKQWGRWQTSAEGRYMAGFNALNFRQEGQIAVLDGTDQAIGHWNFSDFDTEFSHIAELRVDLKYQFTKAFFVKVGWTGLYMDRIARAPNMVSYNDPINGVGINPLRHQQGTFVNGLNVGFTINR